MIMMYLHWIDKIEANKKEEEKKEKTISKLYLI